MGFFQRWIEVVSPPASEKFFRHLKELSAEVRDGARMVADAAAKGTLGQADFSASLHAAENRADAKTDQIMLAVRHTMIHPVDPDDLRDIANDLDTVFDTLDHYSWRMEAYRLKPSAQMEAMIQIIVEMTSHLFDIFDLLARKAPDGVDGKYRLLHDLEKQADLAYHEGVRRIHAGGERNYTAEEEALSILEDCSDKCKDVGMRVVVMIERNR